MQIDLPHPTAGTVKLVASPMKLSATPVNYVVAPPLLGQHTESVLQRLLNYDVNQLQLLKEKNVI